jgi:hypothetical protein
MISDGNSVSSASTEPHHGPDLFLVLVPRKKNKTTPQNPSPESCPIFLQKKKKKKLLPHPWCMLIKKHFEVNRISIIQTKQNMFV